MGSWNIKHNGIIHICIFLLSGILFYSCSNNEDAHGKLYVRVYDAPADYQRWDIIIDHLRIHRADSKGNAGWSTINSRIDGPVNLLDLRYGKYDTLVLLDVPAAKYDKLELYFGFCSVTVNGITHQLQLAQNTQELDCDFEIKDNIMSKLSLDFNMDKSVSINGAYYNFNPAIRIQNSDMCGSIVGLVRNNNDDPIHTTIMTFINTDTVSTTSDITQSGLFQLLDLPEGSYSVNIIPDTLIWRDTTFTNLAVLRGQAHDLGIIRLNPK